MRMRPAMYVGSTSAQGLHHLVWEIVDNAVDEALAGALQRGVRHAQSRRFGDRDRQRQGNPGGRPEEDRFKRPGGSFYRAHAGGKFDGQNYKVSGGLHGVGASVVNALSDRLSVEVRRDGMSGQRYRRGVPRGPVAVTGKCALVEHGTTVTFLPDPAIFGHIFCYDTLKNRLRETAFLTRGLSIELADMRNARAAGHFLLRRRSAGLYPMAEPRQRTALPGDHLRPVGFRGNPGGFALQHTTGYKNCLCSFANNISTPEGGTHVTGFYTRPGTRHEQLREELKASGGLPPAAHPGGAGGGAHRRGERPHGGNRSLRGRPSKSWAAARQRAGGGRSGIPKTDPVLGAAPYRGQGGLREALLARKARMRPKAPGTWPAGKPPSPASPCPESWRTVPAATLQTVSCSSWRGTARAARPSWPAAVKPGRAPLRGKILNVEKAAMDKISANAEIKAMISAFGTGILEHFSLEKLRYHKIILMTDADVDGAHITTLLLTFLFRFMPKLIRQGHVFLAQPPSLPGRKRERNSGMLTVTAHSCEHSG